MRENKTENRGKNIVAVTVRILFPVCLAGMVALSCTYIYSVEPGSYFDAAFVSAGNRLVFPGNPGENLYLLLLHGVLFMFGNKPVAGAILQVVLQAAAAFFSYCAVRRLAGGVPAVAALAVWGFIPYISRSFVQLSPLAVTFALNCFAIWLATGIWAWWNRDSSIGNPFVALICYLCVGLMTGFCCSLDVSGVMVPVFLLWVVFLGRKPGNDGEESPGGFWNHKVFVAVFCLLTSVLSFVGSLFLAGYASGNTLYSMAAMWRQMFLPEHFLASTGGGPIGLLILLILFFVVVTERLIRNMLCAQKIRESDTTAEKEDGLLDEETEEVEEKPKEEAEEKPKVRYIENPLPVPKKVVRKAIDFDYEIADDDDFDIP